MRCSCGEAAPRAAAAAAARAARAAAGPQRAGICTSRFKAVAVRAAEAPARHAREGSVMGPAIVPKPLYCLAVHEAGTGRCASQAMCTSRELCGRWRHGGHPPQFNWFLGSTAGAHDISHLPPPSGAGSAGFHSRSAGSCQPQRWRKAARGKHAPNTRPHPPGASHSNRWGT